MVSKTMSMVSAHFHKIPVKKHKKGTYPSIDTFLIPFLILLSARIVFLLSVPDGVQLPPL